MEAKGLEVFEISSLTGQGIQPLLYRIAARLEELPKHDLEPPEDVMRFTVETEADSWEVSKHGGEGFVVKGKPVEILVKRTDINNEYALRRMHKQLDRMGVIKRLRDLGAQHGDTVRIGDLELEFHDEEYE